MLPEPIKLVIIGAGIAGLSAAVYARKSGIKTLVLEKNHNPGGLSTSWKRKGYTIEGGIHWLTGSSEALPHNRIWKEIGALRENNPIHEKDPLYIYVDGPVKLPLFRNVDRMYEALVRFAPEDAKPLTRLRRQIKHLIHFHMPLKDLRGLKVAKPSKSSFKDFVRMLPAFTVLPSLMRVTIREYICSFRNPAVRDLLGSFINHEQNALSLVYTLATYAAGDGGYPKGGSLVMSNNIADTVTSLGGQIRYGCQVEGVESEKGRVKGVRTAEGLIPADAVIIAADARMAIDKFFPQPLQDAWAVRMRKELAVDQCLIMSVGVRADLSSYHRNVAFRLEKPFEYAGTSCNVLLINNYATENYAPEGCSVFTSLLFGDTFDYWKAALQDGTYKQKKQDIVDRYVALVESLIPEIAGKVEMTDLATPATLCRYCGSHRGGFMTLWEPGGFPATAPVKCDKIEGLYFAGQRTGYSGGLPVAAVSGRNAVQYLCRDFGLVFGA